MPGNTIFIDFNELLRHKKTTLPRDVAKLLDKTTHHFIKSHSCELSTRKTGLSSVFQSESSVVDVSFSHCLVKTGTNQWNVIIGKNKGSGSFGAVNQSVLKIVITQDSNRHYVATLLPAADVVKIQESKNLSHTTVLEMARKEAALQRRHGVTVMDPIDAGDKVITVLEDCGTSLDKLFPLPKEYSFKKRLAIAAMIASEMLLLQQREAVHRDLKPENICYKELGKGLFQIIFIDFGLAEAVDSMANKSVSGTYCYMAPEVYNGKGSSYASDLFALAPILGALMGAKDVLKFKRSVTNYKDYVKDSINASFCFDGMFDGYDASDVDDVLLQDFKAMLVKLADPKPGNRPSINDLNKFLITIPGRNDQYASFNSEWQKMTRLFDTYQGFLKKFNISHQPQKLKKLKPNSFTYPVENITAFRSALCKNQKAIEQEIKYLPAARSHLSLALSLARENRRADFENQDYPFPRLNKVISLLEKENDKFTRALKVLDESLIQLINSKQFTKSNSSGIQKISRILKSAQSPLEQLEKIKKLAADKITPGFWYRYSHSTIFGKGRHKNMEELYERLAKIQPDPTNTEEYLMEGQLEDIATFIKSNNFIH